MTDHGVDLSAPLARYDIGSAGNIGRGFAPSHSDKGMGSIDIDAKSAVHKNKTNGRALLSKLVFPAAPIGCYEPFLIGAYDMIGNVCE